MKVAIKERVYIPIFRFNKSGGFRVLSVLASKLIEKGISVSFISYYQSPKPYYPTTANIIWVNKYGKEVEREEILGSRKRNFFNAFKGIRKWFSIHGKRQDIAIANFSLTTYLLIFTKISRRYYYIQAYEPEMIGSATWASQILRFLAWCSYFLPFVRIVNADIYLKFKNTKANDVVPPGIDLERYCPKVNSPSSKTLTIGCIGRTAEWKGANDVGRAVQLLRNEGICVDFKVAFHEIKMASEEYILVYPDGDEHLAEFYRSLDILIAPGHIQLGAVHYPVVEAMACNTTVITTGYYPASEKNAYIVPIKSPERIKDCVLEIIKRPEQALKKRECALKDVQHMSWDKVSQKLIAIIQRDA